jgi:membrane protease subunit (stomatin/prohibitin family)
MEDFQRRLGNLGAVQSEMGQYRDREFDINKMQPFQDAAAAKSALIEGGIQNLFGASQGFAGLGMGQNKQQSMEPMSQVSQLPMRSMQPVQSMNSGFVPQSVQSVQPFSQSSQFWMPNLRWNYGG